MKIYFDYKVIFNSLSDGVEICYPVINNGDEIVITGVSVSCLYNNTFFKRIITFLFRIIGVNFIDEKNNYIPDFYCVPYVEIFAYNKNGCFGYVNPFSIESSNVVYINSVNEDIKIYKNFVCAFLDYKGKEYFELELFSSKADARRKYTIKDK